MSAKFPLTMVLTRQGPVKGSSTKKEGGLDYSNGMECHGFSYPVETPADSNVGKPVGKRHHGAIIIRKEIDAASPKLRRAFSTNETFRSAALRFNKISPNGEPVLYHTIELTNGTICGIKAALGDGGKLCEDVLLRYEDLFQG